MKIISEDFTLTFTYMYENFPAGIELKFKLITFFWKIKPMRNKLRPTTDYKEVC